MLKGLLILACIAHVLCGYSDCLLSYGKNGRLNLKEINDPAKMAKMFEAMPLWQPMASILLGTFSITAFTFGYLALASWMHGYNTVTAYIMLVGTVLFVVPIVTHHIICGLVEWFYIKLGRTKEARKLVLEFQKKTIVTMIVGYLGELLFLISFLVMVVSKQTSLPQWAGIVNTLPIMLLILPTKIPAKGNVAGAIMFLGLAILL